MKRYITESTNVDIDTGEIIENPNTIQRLYKRVAVATNYIEIDSKTIKKRIIIKLKHNGQTEFGF